MSYWAVAQTEPMGEMKAITNLARQSFEAYCPFIKAKRVVRGSLQGFRRALFPRYIFVFVVDHWYSILTTIGINGVLMTSGSRLNNDFSEREADLEEQPAQLADTFIQKLKAREQGGLVVLPEPLPFKMGEKVFAKHGPMAQEGLYGLYDGAGTSQCERVLYELLGQKVPVNIPLHNLVSCSA